MNITKLKNALDKINALGIGPTCPFCGKPGKIVLAETPFGPALKITCAGASIPPPDIDELMEQVAMNAPISAVEIMLKLAGIDPNPLMPDIMSVVNEARERLEQLRTQRSDGEFSFSA